MKRFLIAGFTLFGIGVSAQNAQYINSIPAYSNEINAGSARYIGMGGAMGALGGDISSIEQNPAGLAIAIASDANVTLGINSYKNEARFGNSFDTDDNTVIFQNVGASFVFNTQAGAWNRFSIGVKFSQESIDNWIQLGRNQNITAIVTDEEDPDLITNYTMDGYVDEVAGYKTKMTLDFGASYNDRVYLGLGLNLHEVLYDNYVVFAEDTQSANLNDVYYYDLDGSPYSSRGSGFSVSAGVIAKANDKLRFGLAYHSPTWFMNIEETFYANLENVDGYNLYYGQYDRNSNSRLVASVGLVVGKSLALNADYTLHINGTNDLKPSSDFPNTNQFLDDNLKSSSEIRLGGEYRIDKFRVRAGYNFVQSIFDETSINADFGTGTPSSQNISDLFVGDTNRFSIGAGYDFGGFYLDAAYQYQNQKYNYLFGNGNYYDYDGGNLYYSAIMNQSLNNNYNYVAEVDNTKGMFLVTAGWQF